MRAIAPSPAELTGVPRWPQRANTSYKQRDNYGEKTHSDTSQEMIARKPIICMKWSSISLVLREIRTKTAMLYYSHQHRGRAKIRGMEHPLLMRTQGQRNTETRPMTLHIFDLKYMPDIHMVPMTTLFMHPHLQYSPYMHALGHPTHVLECSL